MTVKYLIPCFCFLYLVLKIWKDSMFTCISYSYLPQWMMEFKQLVRCYMGKYYMYSFNCLIFFKYYFIIFIKCSVLALEKTLGIYFLTWSAMNSASLTIRPSYFRNRRQCWPPFFQCCLPSMLSRWNWSI